MGKFKKNSKNNHVSARLGDETFSKLQEYSEITGIGLSSLVGISVNQFVMVLSDIFNQLDDAGQGKAKTELFKIVLEKRWIYKHATLPLINVWDKMPYEDKLMIMLSEKSKHTKRKNEVTKE